MAHLPLMLYHDMAGVKVKDPLGLLQHVSKLRLMGYIEQLTFA